jgi:hypothetical protein
MFVMQGRCCLACWVTDRPNASPYAPGDFPGEARGLALCGRLKAVEHRDRLKTAVPSPAGALQTAGLPAPADGGILGSLFVTADGRNTMAAARKVQPVTAGVGIGLGGLRSGVAGHPGSALAGGRDVRNARGRRPSSWGDSCPLCNAALRAAALSGHVRPVINCRTWR